MTGDLDSIAIVALGLFQLAVLVRLVIYFLDQRYGHK